MKTKCLSFLTALLVVASWVEHGNGQTPQAQTPICSKDLVLQITNYEGQPPAFQRVTSKGEYGGSVWYASFKMNPKWQQPKDTRPPRAVNIVSSCSGETANIRVSVFTGFKSHEREELVGNYSINENDKFLVKELNKFGIEPFAVSVIGKERTSALLPAIDNQAASLQVSVESVAATLPTFKLKALNNSPKAVIAIALETRANGRVGMLSSPRGYRGGVLIKPNETYEKEFPGSLKTENLSSDKVPEVRSNQMLVIKSVIFEDGSFEGDEREAAQIDAFYLGDRIQIENILPVLEGFLTSESQSQTLERLEANVRTLPESLDKERFNSFIVKHNVQDKERIAQLKITAAVALRGQKYDLINAIGELRTRGKITPEGETLPDWVRTRRDGYKTWLERLSR
jgi:hypothetical protein